jgi:hypothetical protein
MTSTSSFVLSNTASSSFDEKDVFNVTSSEAGTSIPMSSRSKFSLKILPKMSSKRREATVTKLKKRQQKAGMTKQKGRSEASATKVEKTSKKGRRVVKKDSPPKPKAPVMTPAEREARKKELASTKLKKINSSIDMMRLHVPGCVNVPDKVTLGNFLKKSSGNT